MAAAAAEVIDEFRNYFSNSIITWRIHNISLSLCPLNTTVNSPDFILSGGNESIWRLSLHISQEACTAVMYLKLLGVCYNRNCKKSPVKVNWIANLMDDDNSSKTLMEEKELEFDIFQELPVQVFELDKILNILPQQGPDDLNIKCYMFVNFNLEFEIPINAPTGLVQLSDALSELPKVAFADVALKTSEKLFYLNKDMLFSRGPGLANLILLHGSKNQITLLNYDSNSAEALFCYLYSGNLRYIFTRPRIGISDQIELFGLPELKDAYPKEIIDIESNIGGKEYVFKWMINNFENLEKSLKGSEFCHDGINSQWQIIIHPKGPENCQEHKKKYVFVDTCLLASKSVLDVCIDFSCLNDQDEVIYSRRVQQRMKAKDKVEAYLFLRNGTIMKKCLVDKALILCFTIRIATGQVFPEVKEVTPPPSFFFHGNNSIVYFSKHMESILLQPRFPDIIISNGRLEVRAHRFLLAARSRIFKDKLQYFGRGCTYTIPYVAAHCLRVFLEYLYTGLMSDCSIGTMHELQGLSCTFRVRDLELMTKCFAKVNEENVLEALMYADDRKLVSLKTESLKMLSNIGYAILDHRDWRSFSVNKPQLTDEVLYLLSDKQAEHVM